MSDDKVSTLETKAQTAIRKAKEEDRDERIDEIS